ncbi:MAG: FUSC family protein, partial [Trebonia sp.]
MKIFVTSASGRRPTVADWLDSVVPDWLAEVMVPKKAAPPWGTMARAVVAIWAPLAVGFITGHREIGLLPAMGGLMSIMIDNGGTLGSRVTRVGSAAILGGALGLAIGTLIHGHGWIAVIAIVLVAGVSSLLARLGGIGSVTGLQFMVYTAICLGPFGTLRPWWHTALEFVAGAAWALLLIVPGWLLAPRAVEQRLIADVYHRIADGLRATGTPGSAAARRNVTAALNAAYDALLTRRSASGGRSRRTMRLVAILNVSHQMAEASAVLRHEHERPPRWVSDTADRLAGLVAEGQSAPLPLIPPQWSASDGALALRDSLVALTRVISGNWTPPSAAESRRRASPVARLRASGGYVIDQFVGGWIEWTFTIRLMLCTGVAAVVSEVLPLTRSYWVVLTVAVVLKPDYGSVFTRALQRGIGTVLGAALGAAILAVVPYGPLLLIPFGILAALLPYGKARSFGLSAVFLTPFVVLLIDLLEHTGWRLAGDRALDTVLGSVIVLLVGYAIWPVSWQAHLPGQFAGTLRVVCAYIDEALIAAWADSFSLNDSAPSGPARRSRLRRQSFRSLSDLRAEFQRTMSEPERISRRAAIWWPAVVGLEELLDAVITVSVAVSLGAPAPDRKSVNQITGTLRAVAAAMEAGLPPKAGPLPSAEDLRPVTGAARSV